MRQQAEVLDPAIAGVAVDVVNDQTMRDLAVVPNPYRAMEVYLLLSDRHHSVSVATRRSSDGANHVFVRHLQLPDKMPVLVVVERFSEFILCNHTGRIRKNTSCVKRVSAL